MWVLGTEPVCSEPLDNLLRPSDLSSTSLSRLNQGPGGLTFVNLATFQDTQSLFREVIKCSVKVSCGKWSVFVSYRVVEHTESSQST